MTTVTVLQIKSTMYGFLNELYQGTATGGDSGGLYLTDTGLKGYTSETWPTKITGQQCRITGGASSGDLRMIGKFDPSEGNCYPNRAFSGAIANTDTYEFWGSAVNGGTPLTNLLNDILRDLRPITDTQINIVTNQRIYDITTIVQTRRDIRQVYIRRLDAAGIEPYHIDDLAVGLEWNAYDRGGAGSPTVTLDLTFPLTLATSTQQLWIQAETTFTPAVDDTSTYDALYRDWLAWEMVLELARRKLALGTTDVSRWAQLRDLAVEKLAGWRQRWLADSMEPVRISTFP